MKYLILTLALISAFFVSAETDTNIPAPSKQVVDGKYKDQTDGRLFDSAKEGFEAYFDNSFCSQFAACEIYKEYETFHSNPSRVSYRRDYLVNGNHNNYKFSRAFFVTFKDEYYCPPDGFPEHTNLVELNNTSMCSKPDEPEPEPDPNAKCDEFGNNSMLPPKSGVGSEGQNACYTNPSNGLSCQYVQGGDNFTATGKQCTGDENDYGDRPTPEPPPDGADPNCYNYGSQGQVLICDVDPNEGCNPLTINGTTQYQCPHGCGSIDGVYFCSYDDKDGDGIPDDKNGNGVPDKDETCVNGKCKPNTPDDTTPPTPEKPDMTETNTRLDGVIGELDSIGGKINKTNQTLNGINSGVQGIKQGQDKANGLLTGMSKDTGLIADNTDAIAGNTKGLLETVSKTDVGNTFNPDLSTGFYESSYENGFEGIWAEKSILFEQTETIQFLQQFRFNAGGSPPDTQLCFNMGGSMDFGCADLPTPSPQLLAILKIFILITAAFLCRALIFGG